MPPRKRAVKSSGKSDELLAVEQQHGFVFGLPADYDNTSTKIVGTVSCNNPRCERQGQQHTIHADTPTPVICGGCSHVLLCEHKRIPDEPEVRYSGTLAEPVKHEIVECLDCHTILQHTPTRVRPQDVPLAAFAPGR